MPFATLGFSRHALISPVSDKMVRLEFVMLVAEACADGPFPALLLQIAEELLASHQAILRGDVIGLRGPLVAGSTMGALYATVPVLLPDEFASCVLEVGEQVAIVWLVPITPGEARYVRSHRWDAFEDRLVEADQDLTDLQRAAVIGPPGS